MGVYMYIYITQNQSKCLFKNTHVGVDKCDHITLLMSSILREKWVGLGFQTYKERAVYLLARQLGGGKRQIPCNLICIS